MTQIYASMILKIAPFCAKYNNSVWPVNDI
jgi:hypothetical protein